MPIFILPALASYAAGGMTISLGNGKNDDSKAMSTTMPGYPHWPTVPASHATTIEHFRNYLLSLKTYQYNRKPVIGRYVLSCLKLK
jgi:hypothetical protein